MSVLVDASVLLDVLTTDRMWADWSTAALAEAAASGPVVINLIVYAEVSVRYSNIEELELALPRDTFAREAIPYEAAFLAAKAFQLYRRRGGARAAPLPDFFIGAHAAVAGHRLLTRDPDHVRTYFPKVGLITPGVM
jgi:predicted nucleic acid-binding protein